MMPMPKSKTTFLLGAFDRFNYGDLLFPIIVRNEIAQHSASTQTSVHALIDSDLSHYGALPTRSMRAIYDSQYIQAGDTILFAGGGTIGVDWTYMLANLLNKNANTALYYATRLLGNKCVDTLSRKYFGARAAFPWVAEPNDFPVPVKIAYNAVGGSEFATLSPEIRSRTLACLAKSSYLSVRDAETKRLFSPLESNINVELAPDSAVLMSEQFPVEWLQQNVSPTLLERLNNAPYVCFHSNLNFGRKNHAQIVKTLEKIYSQYGLRAVLLPIGRYVGLDDEIALREILSALSTPAEIISGEASIFEIMLTIAKAKVFVGTSLHGNVTSQSFAVPHIGLSNHVCKLDHYLQTWDIPEQARCIPIREVAQQIEQVLSITPQTLGDKRSELIRQSHENFAKLANKCEIVWKP